MKRLLTNFGVVAALFAALLIGGNNVSAFALEPVHIQQLPPETHRTLQLIKQGGPFPYKRDGITFGNYEKRLPYHPRGYYSEYTVPTPGSRDRGARRIIAGGKPESSGEYYYTDDHYRSFRRIKE